MVMFASGNNNRFEAVCELTVCNVQFAHRFGQNGENCTSLFQTMCKKKLINVSCLQINAN